MRAGYNLRLPGSNVVSGKKSRLKRCSDLLRWALQCRIFYSISILVALLLLLFFISLDSESFSSHTIPVVHTINGSYTGYHLDSFEQDVFLGMPFAAPPLGPLRFRHPQSLAHSWSSVRDATTYSPQCPGYGGDSDQYSHSEDCLTINIIRPVTSSRVPLPVAVYIYGGGAAGRGGSDNQRYNMSFIIASSTKNGLPFIGVSFNYRSSLWGFIISRQVRGTGNTNIGLHDQRKALEWVQENIGFFGGDPRKVTIWGGSSGARDVGYHLIANNGRHNNLFRAATMQSGGPVMDTSSRHYPVQELYDTFVRSTGCSEAEDSLDCLRHLPFEVVNNAFKDSQPGIGPMIATFGLPSIDGDFLMNFGSLSLKDYRMANVPVISGIVSDEGTVQLPGHIRDWSELQDYLIETLSYPKSVVERLMGFYPPIMVGNDDKLEPPLRSISSRAEYERVTQLLGDLSNNAAAKLLCTQYASFSACYNFRFDGNMSNNYEERLGIRHGSEIAPLFRNFNGEGFEVNPFLGKPESFYEMSHLMGKLWAGFITSMDPNVGLKPGDLAWPRYSPDSAKRIVFNGDKSWVEIDDSRAEALAYINSIQDTVLER